MTDKLPCPFCGKPLQSIHRSEKEYWCENKDCLNTSWMFGSPKLWHELDRTRKALDVAVERLKNIVLDVEVLATPEYLADRAKETLEQINEIKGGKDE